MSYKSSPFPPFMARPTLAARSRFRTVSRLKSNVMAIWEMFMYRIGVVLVKKDHFSASKALLDQGFGRHVARVLTAHWKTEKFSNTAGLAPVVDVQTPRVPDVLRDYYWFKQASYSI